MDMIRWWWVVSGILFVHQIIASLSWKDMEDNRRRKDLSLRCRHSEREHTPRWSPSCYTNHTLISSMIVNLADFACQW